MWLVKVADCKGPDSLRNVGLGRDMNKKIPHWVMEDRVMLEKVTARLEQGEAARGVRMVGLAAVAIVDRHY